ncbi:MAG: hypothetical protein AAGI53_15935 [Planctomycetota bacterium]
MSGLFAGTSLERPVTCEHCNNESCACPKDAKGNACPPKSQSPRVRREKRRGKWNTIIADIHASPGEGSTDLKPLLKDLRTRFGTGGGLSESETGPEIVLQGDHRDEVVSRLTSFGYRAKASGG